jgi:phage baseplate assembly protein W
MANGKHINIQYPFKDSKRGFFLELNDNDNDAIKSDLLHLILTRKGERFYNPEFGTDLLRFIFEPEDGITLSHIKEEITNVIKRYLPKLDITNISVDQSDENYHAAVVRIDYNITDNVFTTSDFVIINV